MLKVSVQLEFFWTFLKLHHKNAKPLNHLASSAPLLLFVDAPLSMHMSAAVVYLGLHMPKRQLFFCLETISS